MKVSFITTVFQEEKTIELFLYSLLKQSIMPDEVIIVDGGSTDNTVGKIKDFFSFEENKLGNTKIKVFIKRGNRSIGRNEAVFSSSHEIILCSDAGCILDRKWTENITKPFSDNTVDVVSGYYKGKAENDFQKCLVPYVLVMEDRVDRDTFLPSTRSIAFTKSIWKKVGGFPEKLSHNEDYVFAKELKKRKAKIIFKKNAIVYWIPRKNLSDAFHMFYRFAKGDIEAGILRPKVILIFLRYFFLLILSIYGLLASSGLLYVVFFFILLYLLWSIVKNYKYVRKIGAFFYLPIIQVASDLAVIKGTLSGLYVKF